MRKKIFMPLLILAVTAAAVLNLNNIDNKLTAEASASAEISMELITGKILQSENADQRLPMASTTKIMTALIVIEDCNLDEVLTVPDKAVGVEGSSIYLKKDEEINVRDLLYGLMLRSGNDAATALAIHHSGSVENFVSAMNERAKALGANNTNFKNPSGLPDSEHYTTARDLCEIARTAMKNGTFKEIVSTTNYKGTYRNFANKNKMLYNYEGANGVKTGYTVKAGRCLVSSAERDGMDIICVVLNCPEMYERSSEILDNCFNTYKLVKIDENYVFMSDRVLCKPQNTGYFVVNKQEQLDYKVIPMTDKKVKDLSRPVARLEIYGKNGLIFEDNLFSIVDSNI